MMLNITVVGTGYVGLSNAVLFARQHTVTSLDIDAKRVELINQRLSPIADDYIEKTLKDSELKLTATLNKEAAYKNALILLIHLQLKALLQIFYRSIQLHRLLLNLRFL